MRNQFMRGLIVITAMAYVTSAGADDPSISAEITMDDPVAGQWNANEFYGVDMATNGDNHLVVWSTIDGAFGELFGARIDATTGEVLDPQGIYIGPSFDNKGNSDAVVASNGTDYLVVWWHALYYSEGDIYAARVSGSGVLIDEEPIPIGVSAGVEQGPDVASANGDYLVAWAYNDDVIPAAEIRTALVASDTGDLSAFEIIPPSTDSFWISGLASNGSDFIVAWSADDVLLATRVNGSSGMSIDDPPITITDQVSGFELVSNGTNYLFAFPKVGSGLEDIRAVLVDGVLGTVIDGNIVISTYLDEGPAEKGLVATASDGDDFVVTWSWQDAYHDYVIRGARIDGTNGDLIDTEPVLINSQTNHVCRNSGLSYAAGSYLSLWEDADWMYSNISYTTYGHVAATRVDAQTLDPVDDAPTTVAPRVNRQDNPAVAFDGSVYLVVWTDYRDRPENETDIFGVRVDADGIVLDPDGIAICSAAGEQEQVAVAAVEGTFLVNWYDDREPAGLYGARVSAGDGTALDPGGVFIAGGTDQHSRPAAASNGERFLVVWSGDSINHAVLLGADSMEPLGDGPALFGNSLSNAGVASDGQDFMVVWTNESEDGEKIHATKISSTDGEPVGEHLPLIPGDGGSQYDPAIAFDGERYLVSWMKYYFDSGEFTSDISAVRVGVDGVPVDEVAIDLDSTAGRQLEPMSASDGTSFIVAYYSCGPVVPDAEDYLCETRARRVRGADGVVLDPEPMLMSGGPEGYYADQSFYPGVAYGENVYFVAYNNLRGGLPRISANLIARAPCEIEGEGYDAGEVSSDDQCQMCIPEWSIDSWTQAPAGTPCDDGDPETVDDICLEDGTCAGSGPDGGSDGSSSGCDCRNAGGRSPGVEVSLLELVFEAAGIR